MSYISVFDMLKVGIGPSSSHTLGPWRAAQQAVKNIMYTEQWSKISAVRVDLYGSLSLTGKGHATDKAVIMGLIGYDPEIVPTDDIPKTIQGVVDSKQINLAGKMLVGFDQDQDIVFNSEFLSYHANGIKFTFQLADGKSVEDVYYSIGGGFIARDNDSDPEELSNVCFPFPIDHATQLTQYCQSQKQPISVIVRQNELTLRSAIQIDEQLLRIWHVMLESIYAGCHSEGNLPGGLNVRRRAFDIHKKLIGDDAKYDSPQEWLSAIRNTKVQFRQILKWVSCYALAVNEVNASMGRVVTAPTNGSAGVIPAVLMYYLTIENHNAGDDEVIRFLLTASEIGSIFKKGATISAAMGGCQAEIGVSSAMAAGALTELLGGSPEQVLTASEIAMEHHLGLTCDPVGGLVQIPCIERNSMGAIKAISAAELALDSDPKNAKVSLDQVIHTMWETAQDMNHKYKETSQGGLAIKISQTDC